MLIEEDEEVFEDWSENLRSKPGDREKYGALFTRETDRDGLPCSVCGGSNATGHQRLCSTLYPPEGVKE